MITIVSEFTFSVLVSYPTSGLNENEMYVGGDLKKKRSKTLYILFITVRHSRRKYELSLILHYTDSFHPLILKAP